jgi:hypothetical protein
MNDEQDLGLGAMLGTAGDRSVLGFCLVVALPRPEAVTAARERQKSVEPGGDRDGSPLVSGIG